MLELDTNIFSHHALLYQCLGKSNNEWRIVMTPFLTGFGRRCSLTGHLTARILDLNATFHQSPDFLSTLPKPHRATFQQAGCMVASVVGSFWHDQNFSLINQYLVLQPKWYRGRSRCGDRRSRSHQGRRPDKIVHLQIIFSSWKHLGSSRSGVSHCGVVGGSSNDGGTQPLSKNRDWLAFKSNPQMLSRYIKHWIDNFGPSTLLGVF